MKTNFYVRRGHSILDSREAYKLWSQFYDSENDNLVLHSDSIILKKLLAMANLNGKTILDYGSGTGRNWNELLGHHPSRIIGCDKSPEMLNELKIKYPAAETYLVGNNKLDFLKNKQCDTIISTLVVSHIQDIKKIIYEWNRVLKDSCDVIITDLHPILFRKGGARTFNHIGSTYKIENFIHDVWRIVDLFSFLGFWKVNLIEEFIDEDVKPFYVKKDALNVYEKFKGLPFIYGLHLSRMYADKKY
ncbi:MAG: class I SAM-dependent methyltransferase [Ignavibacteriaceae bacterium]|nr:class I SAM-dependent methyltransferase [Ignavibacteriaceae bacterium]